LIASKGQISAQKPQLMQASYSMMNSARAGTALPVAGSFACAMWITWGGQIRWHWKQEVQSSWPVSSS
jgi:hypothetical protein